MSEAFETHAPDGNTAAVITKAATTGVSWHCNWVEFSYDVATTGIETLTIAIGGTTVFTHYIPTAEVTASRMISFNGGMYTGPGQAMVITLSAAGGTIKGAVNAHIIGKGSA